MVNRLQAKLAAKNCMRMARISPYQIALVYVIILFVLSAFEQGMLSIFGVPTYLDYVGMYTMQPSSINVFVSILVLLLTVLLQAGFTTYCLGVRRGLEMPLSTLFDSFSMVGKVVLLYIVQVFFVSLWMLLFFFPGIIALYRYRFALYNLLENPEIGVMEAINQSKIQTQGYKWELFVLDLSFIGWNLLNYCTLGFFGIWLQPYYTLTDIAFYDTICAAKGIPAGGGSWQQNRGNAGPYDWNHSYNGQNGPYNGQGGPYGGQNGPYNGWNGQSGQGQSQSGWNGQGQGGWSGQGQGNWNGQGQNGWNGGQNGQNGGWNGQAPSAPEPPQVLPEFPQPPAAPDVPKMPDQPGGAPEQNGQHSQGDPWNRG